MIKDKTANRGLIKATAYRGNRTSQFMGSRETTALPMTSGVMYEMRIIKLKLIALSIAITLLSTTGHAADSAQGYQLYFPDLHLDKNNGERIDEVHITVACGHIDAITKIPDDWNIEIIRAISAVEEFHASAGHGASMLENIKKLNGVIRITVGEKECFDISAKIITSRNEKGQQIELPRSKLKLLPLKQKGK